MPFTEEEKIRAREILSQPQSAPSVNTGSINSSWEGFDQVANKNIAEQRIASPQPQAEDGFFKSLAKDALRPFAEVGTSALNIGESALKLARGDQAGAAEAIGKTREVPFLGETKPAFTGEEGTLEAAQKIGGYGAEIGSWFLGGGALKEVGKQTIKGKVLKGLGAAAKEFPVAGALGMGGREAQQEDATAGSVALQTGLGAAAGLATAPIGGALPLVGSGVRRLVEPLESRVSGVIREAIDKGIKPYFGGNKTPELAKKYYKAAEDAFRTIKEYKPEIMVEEEGVKMVKNPENRREMFEALAESKKKIYNEYHDISVKAGEGGAKYNPDNVIQKIDSISTDKKYNPKIRAYAEGLKAEIEELAGEAPDVIEARIQDLNNSLSGYYDGRVSKAQAQVDASVASVLRKDLDELIEKTTGAEYQAVKNKYASLKTIEKDLARQVNLEARRNPKGLLDFTDIFTGGELLTGILTANPGLIVRGAAARGIKEYIKALNDPNRYIKKVFEVLDEEAKKAVPKSTFKPGAVPKQPVLVFNEGIMSKSLSEKASKIKSGEIFGHTFNMDGSDYTGKNFITTFKSKTIKIEDATPENISKIINQEKEIFGDNVKIGVFKMGDDKVSIDINLEVMDQALAEEIGRKNNQVSIWDSGKSEEIKTGGTGEQKFTDDDIRQILTNPSNIFNIKTRP